MTRKITYVVMARSGNPGDAGQCERPIATFQDLGALRDYCAALLVAPVGPDATASAADGWRESYYVVRFADPRDLR